MKADTIKRRKEINKREGLCPLCGVHRGENRRRRVPRPDRYKRKRNP